MWAWPPGAGWRIVVRAKRRARGGREKCKDPITATAVAYEDGRNDRLRMQEPDGRSAPARTRARQGRATRCRFGSRRPSVSTCGSCRSPSWRYNCEWVPFATAPGPRLARQPHRSRRMPTTPPTVRDGRPIAASSQPAPAATRERPVRAEDCGIAIQRTAAMPDGLTGAGRDAPPPEARRRRARRREGIGTIAEHSGLNRVTPCRAEAARAGRDAGTDF